MEPCGPSRQCHRASVAHHARARTLLPTSPDHHRYNNARANRHGSAHRCGSAIPAAARFAWSYLQYACALICAGSCCSASLADGQRRSVEHHIAADPRRSREGPGDAPVVKHPACVAAWRRYVRATYHRRGTKVADFCHGPRWACVGSTPTRGVRVRSWSH